jgi:4-alpha-glucanotransferase
MLAIFPIQDWLSIDQKLRAADPKKERINDPANPNNKWRWRLHLTNKELLDAASWCTAVTSLIKDSKR